MAKTTAPLLSFGADGQIAKTMVFSSWRGIKYVRRHVVPSNPKTTAQTLTRDTFATLRELWKRAPALARLPWDAYAKGRQFTPMNAFVGENMRELRGDADLADWIGSPGAAGGINLDTVLASPGGAAGEVDVTVTPDTVPTDWAVSRAIAVGITDQAPDSRIVGEIVAGESAVDPYTITLAGFTTGDTIQVSAFIEWTKPDGKLAYSASKNASAVAT